MEYGINSWGINLVNCSAVDLRDEMKQPEPTDETVILGTRYRAGPPKIIIPAEPVVGPGYGTHICEDESYPTGVNRWKCRVCQRVWRKVRINTMLRRKKLR